MLISLAQPPGLLGCFIWKKATNEKKKSNKVKKREKKDPAELTHSQESLSGVLLETAKGAFEDGYDQIRHKDLTTKKTD